MRDDHAIDDGFCELATPADVGPGSAGALPVPAGATAAACHDQAAADRFPWIRRWPAARTAELLRLRECAISAGQIALELGVTRNAVMGKLNRLGLCKPRTRMTVERYKLQRREQKARRRARAEAALALAPRPPSPPKKTGKSRVRPRPAQAPGKALIWRLTERSCRWPLFGGDEPIHEKFYCGDEVVFGAPYCGEHCRQAWSGRA